MNQDLISYYRDRAAEYDRVYLIPEEQQDLAEATKIFQKLFSGKKVLEIACGTGYWTAQISKSATSVFATDINQTVIEIAQSRKNYENVVFEVADMYSLITESKYDALFGGFIWSHILVQNLDVFLYKIKGLLQLNGIIAFIDSRQVKGGSHDIRSITQADEHGNTYQKRHLENGTTHLVLKNFPSHEFLVEKLSKFTVDITYFDLEYYWIVVCKLKE